MLLFAERLDRTCCLKTSASMSGAARMTFLNRDRKLGRFWNNVISERVSTLRACLCALAAEGLDAAALQAGLWGRVPAARGRAVALRVEPLSKAQRLAPDGRPSLTRVRHHPPRSLARKVSPDYGPAGPCRCARHAAIKAAPSSRCRTARSGRRRRWSYDSGPFPCPGIAGLGSFTGT